MPVNQLRKALITMRSGCLDGIDGAIGKYYVFSMHLLQSRACTKHSPHTHTPTEAYFFTHVIAKPVSLLGKLEVVTLVRPCPSYTP